MMNKSDILSAVEQFKGLKIMVIGDVILDAYFKGNVSRISPEAPVPVLDLKTKEYRLGGAANVALNAMQLGAECLLCSMVGSDEAGSQLLQLMDETGLSTNGILQDEDRKTSLKTRIVSGFSQLLRIDEEQAEDLAHEDEQQMITHINLMMEYFAPDAIIFEDYDKGVLTKKLIHHTISLAKKADIPITVDPKRRHFFDYEGVTLFKPNLKELREGLNLPQLKSTADDLTMAFHELNKSMPVESAFFTLSADGAFITDGHQHHHAKAHKRNIADVSGAGDTVIATATCALAVKLPLREVAELSNLAGGWVCQFPGVVSITNAELCEEIKRAL